MKRRVAVLAGGVLVAGVTIAILSSYAAVSEPFKSTNVTEIRFRYSYMDSMQVVVRDPQRIAAIVESVRLRECEPDLSSFDSEVVFVSNEDERTALVNSFAFQLTGAGGGYYEMPKSFYETFQEYRDSTRLWERWDDLH